MAVERLRPYLQRGEFIILTDHQSLTFLDDQVLHSSLQHKAMTQLMGLQFKNVYKKGCENKAADALSKVVHTLELQAISISHPAWLQEVLNSYATDSEAQQKLHSLALVSPDEQGFELCQGIIRKQGCIWIGNNSATQTKLISAFHNSAIGGHSWILPM